MADPRLQIIISAVDKASDQIKSIGKTMGDLAGKARVVGTSMIAAGGGITALAGITIKASSDLNESINAVNVMFGKSAKSILEFGQTASRTAGLSAAQFNQLASTTGAMLLNFGIPMEEAAAKTIDLSTRAADLASVFNTDVNDAMAAIQSGLQGMALPLRRYAVDVTEATLESQALAMGIEKSVSEMTQSEKAQIRLAAIMAQSEKVAGDFVNTSTSFANSMRVMSAETANTAAIIGDSLRPILEQILAIIIPVIKQIGEWIEKNPKLVVAIAAAGAALLILGAALVGFGLIIPPLIAAIGLLTAVSAPWLLIIIGIGVAIVALIAIGVLLWKNWDTIKDRLLAIWETIKDGTVRIFSSITDFLKKWGAIVVGLIVAPVIKGFQIILDVVESILNALSKIPIVGGRIAGFLAPIRNIKASLDQFAVTGFQHGGIVTKPTLAMLGERGPEAVVPLSGPRSQAAFNYVINVHLDGRVIATVLGNSAQNAEQVRAS